MIIAELKYNHQNMERGYTNRTLYINLGTNEIRIKKVSKDMIKNSRTNFLTELVEELFR